MLSCSRGAFSASAISKQIATDEDASQRQLVEMLQNAIYNNPDETPIEVFIFRHFGIDF